MRGILTAASLLALLVIPAAGARAQSNPIVVSGDVALSALLSLSDNHLHALAGALKLAALTPGARSRSWTQIRPLLHQVRETNVPCALWFAKPNGTYWTLDGGLQKASLATRSYFPRLLAGRTVLGDLVVSKSTNRATAIVAIPIVEHDAVVGALGASVYLDRMSEQIREEMRLPANAIFFSFDSNGLVGLNWDKTLIFLQPRKLSPELDRAFAAMLAHAHGRETYVFRGKPRTVLYRKSDVTGWWYAFGYAEP